MCRAAAGLAIPTPTGSLTNCLPVKLFEPKVAAVPAILAGLSASLATLALVMPLAATATVGFAAVPPTKIEASPGLTAWTTPGGPGGPCGPAGPVAPGD